MAESFKEKVSPLFELCKLLESYSASSKDRLECYLELVEHEWIPEDMYIRLLRNELFGLENEIKNAIDFLKGMH